jgi:Flp pilus assembly protein TadG
MARAARWGGTAVKRLQRWTERLRNERGQASVLFALATVALIGFGAIVVDVGRLMLVQVQMQNAMDAGALAGAQQLPYSPSEATAWATAVAKANGYAPAQVTVGCSGTCIYAQGQQTLTNSLAEVIGIPTSTVGAASAASRTAPASYTTPAAGQATPTNGYQFYGSNPGGSGSGGGGSGSGGGGSGGSGGGGSGGSTLSQLTINPNAPGQAGILPFGVTVNTVESTPIGGEVTLKVNAGGSTDGNFGALALGGNGANTYESNIVDGYAGLSVCEVVSTKPGNMAGPTDQGMAQRLANYPNGEADIVIIPVVTYGTTDCSQNTGTEPNGKTDCVVRGFAAFELNDYTPGNGNAAATVQGQFLGAYLPTEGSSAAVSSGIYTSPYLIASGTY